MAKDEPFDPTPVFGKLVESGDVYLDEDGVKKLTEAFEPLRTLFQKTNDEINSYERFWGFGSDMDSVKELRVLLKEKVLGSGNSYEQLFDKHVKTIDKFLDFIEHAKKEITNQDESNAGG